MKFQRPGGQVFDTETLQRAYQSMVSQPWGQLVLSDLAQLCHANETCFSKDPYDHARREGMREVWLHINKHIELNQQELVDLYRGLAIRQER